jgi:serine protease Do
MLELTSINIATELASVATQLRQGTVKVMSLNQGVGTGIIWQSAAAKGLPPLSTIVTNAHVAISNSITVELSDGRVFNAVRTHFDPQQDLAVLKIAATNLTPVTTRNSATLRVGELVLAVGHPFAGTGAVTVGTISAANRRVIMADLQLYPGNSGGPLADCMGRVVGINTMIMNGLAIAIPIANLDGIVNSRSTEIV